MDIDVGETRVLNELSNCTPKSFALSTIREFLEQARTLFYHRFIEGPYLHHNLLALR